MRKAQLVLYFESDKRLDEVAPLGRKLRPRNWLSSWMSYETFLTEELDFTVGLEQISGRMNWTVTYRLLADDKLELVKFGQKVEERDGSPFASFDYSEHGQQNFEVVMALWTRGEVQPCARVRRTWLQSVRFHFSELAIMVHAVIASRGIVPQYLREKVLALDVIQPIDGQTVPAYVESSSGMTYRLASEQETPDSCSDKVICRCRDSRQEREYHVGWDWEPFRYIIEKRQVKGVEIGRPEA